MDSPQSWVPASEAQDQNMSGVVGVQHEDNCQAGAGARTIGGAVPVHTTEIISERLSEGGPHNRFQLSPGSSHAEIYF